MRNFVEILCRGQVAPEWLFDNDPRIPGQIRSAEPLNHRFEHGWRYRQVVRRPLRATQCLLDRRERGRIFVVAAHILEQGEKLLECAFVIDSTRSLNAVRHALMQTRHAPFGKGNANHRNLESALLHHGIERWEDHLVSQVTRHAEEY